MEKFPEQERWNAAKSSGNNEEMRKVLIESYNSGGGQSQVTNVESERVVPPR